MAIADSQYSHWVRAPIRISAPSASTLTIYCAVSEANNWRRSLAVTNSAAKSRHSNLGLSKSSTFVFTSHAPFFPCSLDICRLIRLVNRWLSIGKPLVVERSRYRWLNHKNLARGSCSIEMSIICSELRATSYEELLFVRPPIVQSVSQRVSRFRLAGGVVE